VNNYYADNEIAAYMHACKYAAYVYIFESSQSNSLTAFTSASSILLNMNQASEAKTVKLTTAQPNQK